jgi:hypothetical protein
MIRRTGVLFSAIFVCWFGNAAHAQTDQPVAQSAVGLKVVVVAPKAKSDSEIAIPPATSRFVLRPEKRAGTLDLAAWLHKEAALNGLESPGMQPWHIEITYDQFDEDGDNVHSGVYEEFWAGPKKYKRIYKSDNFNQTDYATAGGLFRQGDQRWPGRAETQVRAEIIGPLSYAATLQGFRARNVERTFSGHNLHCVLIENESAPVSDPTQYCFEPDDSVLRYARGFGWFQTAYNGIMSFQGRNVAQDVEVTDGGKPYLRLHVETIEMTEQVDDADFVPPPDAVGLLGKRVSGVDPKLIKLSAPEWPASLRGQHISVEVEVLVGKDGHVANAHAVSGPSQARKICEDAVRKWEYLPYLVLDQPVEVETKAFCMAQ